MNMNRKMEIEDELFTSLLNGDVYDFTDRIPKQLVSDELAELLYTWSVFKDSPSFNGSFTRHVQSMCARIAEHVVKIEGLGSDYVDEEGNWLEECDRYYDEKKDRQAEGM
jgi:hypothetical protein